MLIFNIIFSILRVPQVLQDPQDYLASQDPPLETSFQGFLGFPGKMDRRDNQELL